MTTFTASEVRELAATIWPDLSGREEVAEALNAFADLLEAREKAVPVAYALFTEKGLIRMWSREWFADAHGAPVNPTPLYVHPTPADAERLAEALRNGLIDALRHQRQIDGDGAEVGVSRQAIDEAAAILSALAAHSAQTQPPATSVPDAMQELADKYHELLWAVARKFPGETRHETALRYIREAECQEAALAAQENPNG